MNQSNTIIFQAHQQHYPGYPYQQWYGHQYQQQQQRQHEWNQQLAAVAAAQSQQAQNPYAAHQQQQPLANQHQVKAEPAQPHQPMPYALFNNQIDTTIDRKPFIGPDSHDPQQNQPHGPANPSDQFAGGQRFQQELAGLQNLLGTAMQNQSQQLTVPQNINLKKPRVTFSSQQVVKLEEAFKVQR